MRLGFFGGTFDPIHLGHLSIAKAALQQAHLDKIFFIPSLNPPHKQRIHAPSEDRFAMVELCCKGKSWLIPSRIELDRPGPSYSIDTLKTYHHQYPEAELFFILGEDSLNGFRSWKCPDEILSLCTLIVAPRRGIRKYPFELSKQVQWLRLPFQEISSSSLREKISGHSPWKDYVPKEVADYIENHQLYGSEIQKAQQD